MPDRSCLTVFFPIPLIFRYHLPLSSPEIDSSARNYRHSFAKTSPKRGSINSGTGLLKRLQIRVREGSIVGSSQFLCTQMGYPMKGILFWVLQTLLYLAVRSVLYEGPEENQEISPGVSNEIVRIECL
jgi:hypothetical protein